MWWQTVSIDLKSHSRTDKMWMLTVEIREKKGLIRKDIMNLRLLCSRCSSPCTWRMQVYFWFLKYPSVGRETELSAIKLLFCNVTLQFQSGTQVTLTVVQGSWLCLMVDCSQISTISIFVMQNGWNSHLGCVGFCSYFNVLLRFMV